MRSVENQNPIKLEDTSEKEPCAAPGKITGTLAGIYQRAAADLPVQLTAQGTSGRSNTGSLCLPVQVIDLIQKTWKHTGKNHKGLEYSGNSQYLGGNPTNL